MRSLPRTDRLVGEDSEPLYEELKQNECVHTFLGRVPHSDVDEFLQAGEFLKRSVAGLDGPLHGECGARGSPRPPRNTPPHKTKNTMVLAPIWIVANESRACGLAC